MFRCDSCKTEYGGIRGVTADRCPRCEAAASTPVSLAAGYMELERMDLALTVRTGLDRSRGADQIPRPR